MCSACKKKPSSVAWASMQGKVAVGDRCSPCTALHGQGFSYLSWAEFAKLSVSEELHVSHASAPI